MKRREENERQEVRLGRKKERGEERQHEKTSTGDGGNENLKTGPGRLSIISACHRQNLSPSLVPSFNLRLVSRTSEIRFRAVMCPFLEPGESSHFRSRPRDFFFYISSLKSLSVMSFAPLIFFIPTAPLFMLISVCVPACVPVCRCIYQDESKGKTIF